MIGSVRGPLEFPARAVSICYDGDAMVSGAVGLLSLALTGSAGGTLAVMPTRFDAAARAALPDLFDDFLVTAVHDASGVYVISEGDLTAVIGHGTQRELLGCSRDWCLAELARTLGASEQLVFRILRVADTGWLAVGRLSDAGGRGIEVLRSVYVEGSAGALLRGLTRLVVTVLAAAAPTEVVRPSPFQDRVVQSHWVHPGTQCAAVDPEDCELQCLRRHAGSCEVLATAYLMGKGRPVVWGRAAIFYEQACDLGAVSSCNSLGVLHRLGFGVLEDLPRARSLFELACDGGDDAGCRHLAMMLSGDARRFASAP